MAAKTNETFMEIVRQYPVLYDRFSKDFKVKVKRIMLGVKLLKLQDYLSKNAQKSIRIYAQFTFGIARKENHQAQEGHRKIVKIHTVTDG
jgi:hypothetical protein